MLLHRNGYPKQEPLKVMTRSNVIWNLQPSQQEFHLICGLRPRDCSQERFEGLLLLLIVSKPQYSLIRRYIRWPWNHLMLQFTKDFECLRLSSQIWPFVQRHLDSQCHIIGRLSFMNFCASKPMMNANNTISPFLRARNRCIPNLGAQISFSYISSNVDVCD